MRSRRRWTDCDAKVLFLSEQYRGLVEPYEERLGKLIAGGRIAYDFRRAGWRDFEEWLERASDAPFEVALDQLDDFNIIYSSGTTGLPKGILHSHVMRDLLAVAVHGLRLWPRHGLARLNAALLQHDAGRRAGHDWHWRHDHPDAAVRTS